MKLELDPRSAAPLVAQIVERSSRLIDDGTLRAGTKVPSIRQFAHAHAVSVFTVVEAYDRRVALGCLVSRPHSGFFVRRRSPASGAAQATPPGAAGASFDAMWYLRKVFENRHLSMKPRCGWLPGGWLFGDGVKRALRALAAAELDFGGCGDPKGYAPLRRRVCDTLAEHDILLCAGRLFAADLRPTPCLRFNVVFCDDERLFDSLGAQVRAA